MNNLTQLSQAHFLNNEQLTLVNQQMNELKNKLDQERESAQNQTRIFNDLLHSIRRYLWNIELNVERIEDRLNFIKHETSYSYQQSLAIYRESFEQKIHQLHQEISHLKASISLSKPPRYKQSIKKIISPILRVSIQVVHKNSILKKISLFFLKENQFLLDRLYQFAINRKIVKPKILEQSIDLQEDSHEMVSEPDLPPTIHKIYKQLQSVKERKS